MKLYPASPKLREALKFPLGILIKDEDISKDSLEPLLLGKMIVCVGDRTTERVRELGFSPKLEIVDLVERRKPRIAPVWSGNVKDLIRVSNPAGSISSDSLASIRKALEEIQRDSARSLRLQVEGEEDLLVLPVLSLFPDDTVVLYGQPLEGLVVVSATDAREKALGYLQDMGISSAGEGHKESRLSIIQMLKSPREAIRQNAVLIKFMIVGASGVVLGLVLLTILKIWLHPAIANTISVELTIVSNFVLNDMFTFRQGRFPGGGVTRRLYRLVKYNIVSLAGLALNSVVFFILNSFGVFYVWSYLIAVLAAFVLNYFGSSRWAWRSVITE